MSWKVFRNAATRALCEHYDDAFDRAGEDIARMLWSMRIYEPLARRAVLG